MAKRDRKKPITIIFAIGLLIVGVVAGQSYLARVYRQQAEVGYRRALAEFATHLQELKLEIGRARLAESGNQRQQIAADIGRLVYAIQGNLGGLPLGELQLERISRLINEIHAHAFPLAAGRETKELAELYDQVKYLDEELQKLLVRKEQEFPWVSWHEYLTASPVVPNLLRGLALLNDSLQEFKTPGRSGEISGVEISREEAAAIAGEFMQRDLVYQVTNESKGVVPAYTVEGKEGEERIVLEISQRGGMVLWMASTKEVHETKLTLTEMVEKGREFLETREFPPLYLTDAQTLQHRAILTFVPIRGGILHYGEPVKVQVSASDGSVLGFWGTPFYIGQSRRGEDQVTEVQEVQWDLGEKIRPGAVIHAQRLALVPAAEGETLVKRVGIEYGGEYYLIYLNARTGEEELIVPVSSPQFF